MKKDEGDIFSFEKEPEMPEEKSPISKLIEQIVNVFKILLGKK